MKKLLIAINCILAFLLVLNLWGAFSSRAMPQTVVAAKKKKSSKTTPAPAAAPASENKNVLVLPDAQTAASLAVRKNIFDNQRTGGVTGPRGNATYSLVGITRVGNFQSAVILSKGNVRQRNGMPVKQYYRVGDELPNGYVLSKINPDGVLLSRGSSTITLPLAQASENFPTSRGRRSQPNQMQQMLDLMRQQMGMQQRQQMDMMRMMRNNQNNGNSGRSGSTNSRGRRR